MLGVGQRTILEHQFVGGKFILKLKCIAVFIYQNDYYYRVNEQIYDILSKMQLTKCSHSCICNFKFSILNL